MEPNADAGRARFDAAVAAHLTAPLAGGITLRHVTGPEIVAINERLWGEAARAPFGALDRMYTEEQRAHVADLGAVLGKPLAHRVVLLDGEDVIGGYLGQQSVLGRYHMVSSVVAPAYQGRGIYRELLARVVAAVRDSGFTEIHSWHRADNNAVIVPKLRAGFLIMGFEVTTRFGVLVQLRRYLVEDVELLHRYRVDGSFAEQLRSRGLLG
jgi:GNAT superfamily N-acetyltransferase